ncbi:MAG: AbrB/MazE/SpoVT family DNA-binding domain-containing protein [Acidobacteria bacterium]|nr:AbrB/MazE/SpoVT family DNA-binding domain-containing protein [Acidobacteriota bacterium]
MRVQVQKRGQITIPKKLRERLDLSEGDILDVELEGPRLVLTPGAPSRVILKVVPARVLQELRGVVAVGGDALEDSEKLYD